MIKSWVQGYIRAKPWLGGSTQNEFTAPRRCYRENSLMTRMGIDGGYRQNYGTNTISWWGLGVSAIIGDSNCILILTPLSACILHLFCGSGKWKEFTISWCFHPTCVVCNNGRKKPWIITLPTKMAIMGKSRPTEDPHLVNPLVFPKFPHISSHFSWHRCR